MQATAETQIDSIAVLSDMPEKPARRRRTYWIIAVLLVLVVGGLSIGMAANGSNKAGAKAAAEKDEKKKAAIPVSVAAVETGTVSSYIRSTANLVSDNEVKVLTESDGRIARLFVDEGDWVSKGQTLATLDREDTGIDLAKQQARSENARLVYERGERMLREGLISQETFEKLRLENEMARQEVAEAKYTIGKTAIRAPFSGRITSRIVEQGQHIRIGEELFNLADFDPLIAYIHLPEKEVLGLQAGRETRITLKADESVRFRGRIRQISPVVDTATGTVKVTVEAVAPLPAAVRPGGFVTIDIVRESLANSVLLPRQAVLREMQSAHVFVAANGVAQKRPVQLGLEEGERIQVLSGVRPGERVIIAGQGSLKQGSVIEILGAAGAIQTAKQRAAESAR
ncbi:MAG TPA: efflux RND transporter periplasmic adaptor subunit [Thermoanaerobaculia bacterium]|nr:efflux RND transporter periplasmic adaptor subunit [Thermoanaerobaculia bacterium]